MLVQQVVGMSSYKKRWLRNGLYLTVARTSLSCCDDTECSAAATWKQSPAANRLIFCSTHTHIPVCHRSWLESELTAHCFKFKLILDNTSLLWLIHCYVTIRHRTTLVSARIRANGNFGDVSMEWLHSVSVRINHVMSQDLRFWGKTFVLISCSKHCLGTRNFRGHSPKCPRRDYGPVMSPSDAVDLESPLIGLLWWI